MLRSIRQLAEGGQDFLRIAALLAAAPIPANVVQAVLRQADGLDVQQARDRAALAIDNAAKLSLASKATTYDQAGLWLIHSLVARTIRYREPNSLRLATLRKAATIALAEQLRAITDARSHASIQAIVPHARELAHHLETTAEAGPARVGRPLRP